MLAKSLGSDTSCSVYVSLAHRMDGRANKARLTRREIPDVVVARFHSKYQKTPSCWLWTAGKYRDGYGMVNLGRFGDGRQHTSYAHRIAYVLAVGEIPQGAVVMHACDVTACVNPSHLRLGTQGENVRDCFAKGRQPKTRNRSRKAA